MDEILNFDHSNGSSERVIKQYFLLLLLIMLYMVILTFESVEEILKPVATRMKATEEYFPVMLFNMLYKVVLHDLLSLWMKS